LVSCVESICLSKSERIEDQKKCIFSDFRFYRNYFLAIIYQPKQNHADIRQDPHRKDHHP